MISGNFGYAKEGVRSTEVDGQWIMIWVRVKYQAVKTWAIEHTGMFIKLAGFIKITEICFYFPSLLIKVLRLMVYLESKYVIGEFLMLSI